MLKNVKDSTDRHWNMIFFFSGKLTDKMERKTTWMLSPHHPLFETTTFPVRGGGRLQTERVMELRRGFGELELGKKNKIKLKKFKKA